MKIQRWFSSICLCMIAFHGPSGFSPGGTTPAMGADPIPLKDLDGHFPFQPPESLDAWKSRSEEVIRQIKVSQGVWPMPTLAQVNPTIHSEREMDGYSQSKVFFESLPGFYVTGTLYTPRDGKEADVKRPGILCPHGHWENGRFYHAGDKEVRNQLAIGAERFESAARNPMQARCVQLARMGCVVFLYDMIGYADSQQISFERAHRYGIEQTNPDRTDGSWLLFSPQAEGNMQSVMGLQTINSLQAFEFMASRPNVDPSKIAITGASGGGTQSFIAAAIEPRIAAAMPAVMVGTHMQGGCTCENASLLRVGTGNVEIAALIAPRPLGLTAADDWTREVAKDGFPELQKVYELYDAKKKVSLFPYLHFQHNYNHVARVALYGFINKAFDLGFEEPILERDFEFQTKDQLTVWDEQHAAPEQGNDFEARLLKTWRDDLRAKIDKDPQIAADAWNTILQSSNAVANNLSVAIQPNSDTGNVVQVSNANGGVVASGNLPNGQIFRLRVTPKTPVNAEPAVSTESNPEAADTESIERGVLTIIDPTGLEATEDLQPVVKNPRPAPAYTYGYNPTLAQRRAGTIIAILDHLKGAGLVDAPILLEGEGDDYVLLRLVLKARPELVQEIRAKSAVDVQSIQSFRHPAFVPGMLLYGY